MPDDTASESKHSAAVPIYEKGFQDTIIATAAALGWDHIYHTHDSRRSQEGFPDLVLLRTKGGVTELMLLEVKGNPPSGRGKLSRAQADWLTALKRVGGNVKAAAVWPEDMDRLEGELR